MRAVGPDIPPNVIILLAGGWRAQSFDGGEGMRAPHLARLAEDGVRFSRAYTTCPAPAPARASLLTGRFPHACGVTRDGQRLPLGEKTLAEILVSAGYETAFVGHWRLDGAATPGYVPPGERRQGFIYWAAVNRGERLYDAPYFLDEPRPLTARGFEPAAQSELAAEFVARKRERPYLLVLFWGLPAGPRTSPPLRPAEAPESLRLRFNVPAGAETETRREIALYHAAGAAIDAAAGRVLEALEEGGAAGETIVVFTSDHGEMLGSHGLAGAGEAYEEAVRVPLVIRYPRVAPRGMTLDMPVSLADLAPTVLGLAGLGHPAVHGRNLAPLIRGEPAERPESAYVAGRLGEPGEWRMVVRGLDKVVVGRRFNVTHLYNLGQDPYEMWNLAEEKKARRKRDEMQAILRDWMRRTGDRILPSGLRIRE